MPIHVWDGDRWSQHAGMTEAERACKSALQGAIDVAKEDGEWPDWVEDISAHNGPADAEDPSELPCVLVATQINVQTPSSDLDEDGYDSEGECWDSPFAVRCEYDIQPLPEGT